VSLLHFINLEYAVSAVLIPDFLEKSGIWIIFASDYVRSITVNKNACSTWR